MSDWPKADDGLNDLSATAILKRCSDLEARLAEEQTDKRLIAGELRAVMAERDKALTRIEELAAENCLLSGGGRVVTRVAYDAYEERALKAEARLAEALSVIEPFAVDDEDWVGEPDSLNVALMAFDPPRMSPSVSLGHLRAAAAFFAAEKEKRDA